MLNTKFFPLRTTVGKAIRVANVMVVNRSHGLERTKMQEETEPLLNSHQPGTDMPGLLSVMI